MSELNLIVGHPAGVRALLSGGVRNHPPTLELLGSQRALLPGILRSFSDED